MGSSNYRTWNSPAYTGARTKIDCSIACVVPTQGREFPRQTDLAQQLTVGDDALRHLSRARSRW